MSNPKKTVLVAGFFDLVHSGHVHFLERAAEFGDLTVVIGSDENSLLNKNKFPIYDERERQYIIESLRFVKQVVVPKDTSSLNFRDVLVEQRPDYFIINDDGSPFLFIVDFLEHGGGVLGEYGKGPPSIGRVGIDAR